MLYYYREFKTLNRGTPSIENSIKSIKYIKSVMCLTEPYRALFLRHPYGDARDIYDIGEREPVKGTIHLYTKVCLRMDLEHNKVSTLISQSKWDF